jgi:methyltransferase (TIGR00027 family)
MRDQPAARTTFYDAALQRHLPSVEQVVILGAGLDTRAYRRRSRARVRWFEVDTPQTQAFKREMLRRAGVDASGVTFVPADFERQDWFGLLLSAGFQPDEPTFFVWESVTMYLDAEAVERTLRQVASTAEGTAIAFDYFSPEQLKDRSAFMRYARAVLKAVGEPFGRFGLDPGGVGAYLESCGLAVEEQRTFGQPTGRKPEPAGFVTAVVTRRPETADRSAHSY